MGRKPVMILLRENTRVYLLYRAGRYGELFDRLCINEEGCRTFLELCDNDVALATWWKDCQETMTGFLLKLDAVLKDPGHDMRDISRVIDEYGIETPKALKKKRKLLPRSIYEIIKAGHAAKDSMNHIRKICEIKD